MKALFVQHRSRLSTSAFSFVLGGCKCAFIYRDVTRAIVTRPFPWFLRQLPRSSRVRAHTTPQRFDPPQCNAHSRTTLLHLFATTLIRLHRMQLSYCFHGATATHRFSDLLRPNTLMDEGLTPCSSHVMKVGFRVRPWSFATAISGRHTRPRSGIPFTCTRAFVLATSYSRTTLAVLVRQLARGLGTQSPISPRHPFGLIEFPR